MKKTFFHRPRAWRSGLIYLLALVILSGLLSACGSEPGLQRPNGVALATDGSLYVMDLGNNRIVHLSPEGKILQSLGGFGVKPEQIYYGWDIEIDPQGNLYIANLVGSDAGTIHDSAKAFRPDGKLLREYGPMDYDTSDPDVFSRTPYALALDEQNRLYLADFNYGQVRVFEPDGELIDTLFDEEDGYLFGGIGDMDLDPKTDRLYVTDFYDHQVVVFQLSSGPGETISYTHIASFGGYGRADGQFSYPQGIALDSRNDRMYIGDQGNRRIQLLTTSGEFIRSLRPPIASQSGAAQNELDANTVSDWQVIGLELAPDGSLYAADALNNCIWVFDAGGSLLRRIEVQP